MSRNSHAKDDRIQEFYAPRVQNLMSSQADRPLPQPQTHNHQCSHLCLINLQDINKSRKSLEEKGEEEEETPGCLSQMVNHRLGSEWVLFWGWIDAFFEKCQQQAHTPDNNNRTPKSHKQPPSTISSAPPDHHQRPTLNKSPQNTSNSNRKPRNSAFSVSSSRIRAIQADRLELLDYEADHFSALGEFAYMLKRWNEKRAQKKANLERREAKQGRYQEGEGLAMRQRTQQQKQLQQQQPQSQARPSRQEPQPPPPQMHPQPSPHPPTATTVIPIPSSKPSSIHQNPSTIPRKPAPAYSPQHTRNKSSGEVSRHKVTVTLLPRIHSVHAEVSGAPLSRRTTRRDGNSSNNHNTVWSDFMRLPSHDKAGGLQQQQQPAPLRAVAFDRAKGNGQGQASMPASFGGAGEGIAREDSPTLSRFGFPEKARDEADGIPSAGQQQHLHCNMCGALNSPNTHFGVAGVWLCTACRSPTFAQERPPSMFSVPRPMVFEAEKPMGKWRKGSAGGVGKGKGEKKYEDEGDGYPSPPIVSPLAPEYYLSKPLPLDPHKKVIRKSPGNSVSPLSTDAFSTFDSDSSYHTHASTPPPPPKSSLHKNNNLAHANEPWSSKCDEPPAPPKKDSAYGSRLSFYPDTPDRSPPLSSEAANETLPASLKENKLPHSPYSPPPIPGDDDDEAGGMHKPKRSSSIYPVTPRAAGKPAKFVPFAASSVLRDHGGRWPQGSSSVYPDEGRMRCKLPELEFEKNGRRARSHGEGETRDTTFYDFWPEILGERV